MLISFYLKIPESDLLYKSSKIKKAVISYFHLCERANHGFFTNVELCYFIIPIIQILSIAKVNLQTEPSKQRIYLLRFECYIGPSIITIMNFPPIRHINTGSHLS